MSNSFSKQEDLSCPRCGHKFVAVIWLIVDTSERTEMLDRIQAGTEHQDQCANCGFEGSVDAPILLYRHDQDPVLVFSPAARGTTDQQTQEWLVGLVRILRENLGSAWQDSWLQQMPMVRRPQLASFLREGLMPTERPGPKKLNADEPLDDIELEIQSLQQMVGIDTRHTSPEDWASSHYNLGITYALRKRGQRAENLEEAVKHYKQALEVFTEEDFPEKWAATNNNLANAYQDRILGDRAQNLEEAIRLCEQAMRVFTRQTIPHQWARTQHNLGNAYLERVSGNRSENLELSISHFKMALEVRTRWDYPQAWAMTQHCLGAAYLARRLGDKAENLEQSIHHYLQALEVRTQQALPESWARTQYFLGNAYRERVLGNRNDNLEQAMFHYQQALEVFRRQDSSESWARAHYNLGLAHRELRGEQENLEKAIFHYQQASEGFTLQDFPIDWANTHYELGLAYAENIRADWAENLEQAIHHFEEALRVFTRQLAPETWAGLQYNLGRALQERIRGDRPKNLDQAEAHYLQALKVFTRSAAPEKWAAIHNNIAGVLTQRRDSSHSKNLEEAIFHSQQALEVHTPEAFPKQWAMTQRNLGTIYYERIEGDPSENQEQAISHLKQALEITTPQDFPVDWALTQNNLAGVYLRRIRGERGENREQSIYHFREALEVFTQQSSPANWAGIQHNLGTAYLERLRGSREENVEQALHHFHRAQKVRSREAFPADWAVTQNAIGNAYLDRVRGDREENLEDAIKHYWKALEVQAPEVLPREWGTVHNNLGNVYSERIKGDHAENLEQAIHHYREALKVRIRETFPTDWATSQNNLGNAYLKRERGQREQNLKQAIDHYQKALEVYSPQAQPARSRMAARKLGEACMKLKAWDRAAAAFKKAIFADEILYQAALGETGQEFELAEAGDIYSQAAYANIKSGHLSQALQALEQGRARRLRDSLERGRIDLEQLARLGYGELYLRYQDASRRWHELRLHSTQQTDSTLSQSQIRPLEIVTQLETAQLEIQKIVKEIRQVPGYKSFLRSVPAKSIQTLSQKIPLIYLSATTEGGVGLVVNRGEIIPINLEALRLDDLRQAVLGSQSKQALGGYLGAYAFWQQEMRNKNAKELDKQAATQEWFAGIEAATKWLWKACMKQVVQILQEQGVNQVAVIAGGLLGFLPLHAAWTLDARTSSGRRYALDKICFTYAPSAYVLRSAQAGARRPANSLLAVDNPGMDDPELKLLFSGEEVASVAEHFEPTNIHWLMGEAASLTRIKTELPAFHVLHFSTHGLAVPDKPLESFLLLANREKLTLREILELRLDNARLAVLSACETAIPGTKLPDEVVSLLAGLMQAGVVGVIGSLWSVVDASTMMLMARLYDLWRNENHQLSEALRLAQIWLRDTTNGQKEEYFKQSLRGSELVAQGALHQLLLEDSDSRSFAHPFHWAAFGYMGV